MGSELAYLQIPAVSLPCSCSSGQETLYAMAESPDLCAGVVKSIAELLLQLLTEDRAVWYRASVPGAWGGVVRIRSLIST